MSHAVTAVLAHPDVADRLGQRAGERRPRCARARSAATMTSVTSDLHRAQLPERPALLRSRRSTLDAAHERADVARRATTAPRRCRRRAATPAPPWLWTTSSTASVKMSLAGPGRPGGEVVEERLGLRDWPNRPSSDTSASSAGKIDRTRVVGQRGRPVGEVVLLELLEVRLSTAQAARCRECRQVRLGLGVGAHRALNVPGPLTRKRRGCRGVAPRHALRGLNGHSADANVAFSQARPRRYPPPRAPVPALFHGYGAVDISSCTALAVARGGHRRPAAAPAARWRCAFLTRGWRSCRPRRSWPPWPGSRCTPASRSP